MNENGGSRGISGGCQERQPKIWNVSHTESGRETRRQRDAERRTRLRMVAHSLIHNFLFIQFSRQAGGRP